DAGAAALQGAGTRRIDLGGLTVVPGLIDAHGHVSGLGFLETRLDLIGTTSAEEVARMVSAKAATARPGEWILGRGWDQNDWTDTRFPTRQVLDAVCQGHPVALRRVDGHASWASTRAMELAGVTRQTSDPPGGQIIRDASGEPTGVFVDLAEEIIDSKIPEPV